jgi:hypothetical protein
MDMMAVTSRISIMMLIIRFCLIVLLVVLQLAAPLVHAHRNANAELGTSLHLPQFEQIDTALQGNSSFIAPHFQEGEMVTVSAGIKHEQRRFLLSNDFTAFTVLTFFIIAVLQKAMYCFFIKTEPIKTFPFFHLVAPRAPPYFSRLLLAA